MSRGSCILTKKSLNDAIEIIESGACGKSRSLELAVDHIQDAFMRIDYHMRAQDWITPPVAQLSQLPSQVYPPGSIMPQEAPKAIKPQPNLRRPSTLVPAAPVPQLNTGLMNAAAQANQANTVPSTRAVSDVMEDISLL